MTRNPSADRNPLDLASFYVEELKYGPGSGEIEDVSRRELAAQFEVLLRDAGVTSMSGHELAEAMNYYGASLATSLRISPLVALSCFVDGVMHGIALGGGLEGEQREAKA